MAETEERYGKNIRQFKDTPIPSEVLTEIVETASFAPSWKNTQIARYIAVTGEVKEKIASNNLFYSKRKRSKEQSVP